MQGDYGWVRSVTSGFVQISIKGFSVTLRQPRYCNLLALPNRFLIVLII